MARDLAIFDDTGPVQIGLDNPETLTLYAYLKDPEQAMQNIPTDKRAEFIRKYDRLIIGKLYLVRVMDSYEKE